MTVRELYLVSGFYLVECVLVAFLTRATLHRIVGALAGAAALGLVGMGLMVLCEKIGWWRVPIVWEPYFLTLFYLSFLISCTPVCLILWRVVRRFGSRGLALFLVAVAVIGPPRDYFIVAKFPAWMVFAPGIAPILADAATYVIMVAVGYAVMRHVAGADQGAPLARRPWDPRLSHLDG
jgi:hypothetical protein